MSFVHMVFWHGDGGMCCEVFANEQDAKAYSAKVLHSWVTKMAVRGPEFMRMVFGTGTGK